MVASGALVGTSDQFDTVALSEHLRDFSLSFGPVDSVNLVAEGDVPFAVIREVLSASRRAGFEQMSFVVLAPAPLLE